MLTLESLHGAVKAVVKIFSSSSLRKYMATTQVGVVTVGQHKLIMAAHDILRATYKVLLCHD